MAPEDFLVTVKPNAPLLNLISYSASDARWLVGGGVFIGTSYLFVAASYICPHVTTTHENRMILLQV